MNRATADVRQAIAVVATAEAPNISRWLNEIKDPGKRLDMFLRMLEYHVPKLGRMEITLAQTPADQILAELERRAALGSDPE